LKERQEKRRGGSTASKILEPLGGEVKKMLNEMAGVIFNLLTRLSRLEC